MSVISQIQTRPEVIDRRLTEGCAVCCEFNRWGTLLAVGCHDGKVVVWDYDVLGVARVLVGHVRPITSVQWSYDGKRLLTSSSDWSVILWDVLTGQVVNKFSFDSQILSASLHPSGNFALVSPFMEYPKLINLKTGERKDIPVVSQEITTENEEEIQRVLNIKCSVNVVASTFNTTGDLIYTGNGNGIIAIFEFPTTKFCRSKKVQGGGQIKSIWFSPTGNYFLVNCDKTLKLVDSRSLQYIREFMDPIFHPHWKTATFSNDEEYIIGGSAMKPLHNIYVWDRGGYLETTLEGPPEGVLCLRWHPKRRVIASCSTVGAVYIWTVKQTENWSAFAPEFSELEENQPYIEREDEFDVEEEGSGGSKAEEDLDEPLESEEEETNQDELRYLPPSVSLAMEKIDVP